MTLMDIKEVSAWLNLKPSTLYLWVSQGKIPALKIHGVIRFQREVIEQWIQAFEISQDPASARTAPTPRSLPRSQRHGIDNVDALIARAKARRLHYRRGTKPVASPFGKEEGNGTLSER
jgi:excisionase family DNA binding protein